MPAYRRSIVLINKRFQLRFSFYVCSWLILLSLAYPLIISNLFDYFIQYLANDPMGPGLAVLEKTRQEVFRLLIIMQAVFISLAFLLSIFMAHRIAGPLNKLKKFLQDAKDGNIQQELFFRKNDYFMELVPAYNDLMASIRKRIGSKQAGIDTAVERLEKILPGVNPEIRNELQDTLNQLKEAQKN